MTASKDEVQTIILGSKPLLARWIHLFSTSEGLEIYSSAMKIWRRMRDLNPRKVTLYTLSKRAHSATMRILQCSASRPAGRSLSALETMITHRSSVRRYRAELPQDRKVARVGALWRVRGGSLLKGEWWLSLYIENIARRPLLRS